MRLSRFATLFLLAAGVVACGSDNEVTAPTFPPLAQLRFINAVSDTGAVDIRFIDQVDWSPVANNLAFRGSTVYLPAAVGNRPVRVFPTSRDINVTSQIMLDATVSLIADTRVTLLLTGSARAKTLKLWVINDATTAPPAGQISVRMVNAATGQVNGYLVSKTTDPLPGSPTFGGVLPLAPSGYVNTPTGSKAIQLTDAGSTSVTAAAAGPAAPATLPGEFPAAGVTSEGSSFSAYYFPASVAGSKAPQTPAFTQPAVIWFVDRNPCDAPAAAGCTK